jgi:hypothetical protein
MQKFYCLIGFLIVIVYQVSAQDEGTITKRERIDKSSSVFLGGGMSFTFGDNIGDYSRGYNVDAGFVKRLNRILSVGGGISYQTFKYDPDKTEKSLFLYEDTYTSEDGYLAKDGVLVGFDGGKIDMMSLGLIVKVNFVPVKDDSKFSVYAFARPFVSYVKRSEVLGAGIAFGMEDLDDDGEFSEEELATGVLAYGQLFEEEEATGDAKEYSGMTGGVFLGPGIEMNPGKAFSISLQASIGYTFPISFISTAKYKDMSLDEALADDEDYPMTKEGFPSINLQLGFSYNF